MTKNRVGVSDARAPRLHPKRILSKVGNSLNAAKYRSLNEIKTVYTC